MTTTTFAAPDIVCDGCANAIKNALRKVDGLTDVGVDVASKQVTVVGDAPADLVIAALDRAGFPATVASPVDK
jgi:Copper chaperone